MPLDVVRSLVVLLHGGARLVSQLARLVGQPGGELLVFAGAGETRGERVRLGGAGRAPCVAGEFFVGGRGFERGEEARLELEVGAFAGREP